MIISLLILLAFSTICASQQRPSAFGTPNHVSINEQRKHIDADTSWLPKGQQGTQQVSLDASNKEKVVLQLINSQKELSAGARGNFAAAETSDGHRAQAQKFGNRGGAAQAGGHKGQIRTRTDNVGQHAELKADGTYELDTVMIGSGKRAEDTKFQANNNRFNFEVDPNSQDEHDGAGSLTFNDKEKGKSGTYAYAISQMGGKAEAQLSAQDVGSRSQNQGFLQSLFARRSDKYHCTAQTPGVSQCYDANGQSAGKVVADKNGNTIVFNEKDVPIGTGTVRQIGPRSFEATISKNLFIARLKDARRSDCCLEVQGQPCTGKIELRNPTFSHPSQRTGDGTLQITWPDCFDMGIEATLPPGVDINKLAMKLDVMIQPIGKLRCMDSATCGRECYYCDWCKDTRKINLLDNTDSNLCQASGQRTYKLTMKVCPPPQDSDIAICSAFSKSVWQRDYWQKQGAVDVWMKFYERGDQRPQLEREFFAQIENPLLGKAAKLAIIAEWLTANGIDQGSYQPSNAELLEYWVSKRDPDRLVGCEHSVVDFEIEGAKVKTNVLFEAATTANQFPNIFKDKKCAAFEKLQETRFRQEAQNNKPSGGGGSGAVSGILGSLGSLLGGLGNRG